MRPPEIDLRLLEVTTRQGWEPHRILVTYEEVRTDRHLWASMFIRDWDRIPARLREEALHKMLARFGRLIDNTATWCHMTPENWDRVPHPIRAMAFMNMIARWEGCVGVSEDFGLPRELVVARLRAVAMAESWFEHRASNRNADGTFDLGLAQATESTRNILRLRGRTDLADFHFEDEEYFDPLKSTRVLVYWFALMLDETNGSLDLATAAYHVGSGRALRGEGAEYLDKVLSLEKRFMLGHSGSPTWRLLRRRNKDASIVHNPLFDPLADQCDPCSDGPSPPSKE